MTTSIGFWNPFIDVRKSFQASLHYKIMEKLFPCFKSHGVLPWILCLSERKSVWVSKWREKHWAVIYITHFILHHKYWRKVYPNDHLESLNVLQKQFCSQGIIMWQICFKMFLTVKGKSSLEMCVVWLNLFLLSVKESFLFVFSFLSLNVFFILFLAIPLRWIPHGHLLLHSNSNAV